MQARYAHSNAHQLPKTVALNARITILCEIYCSRQNLSIDLKKLSRAHSNAHKSQIDSPKSLL